MEIPVLFAILAANVLVAMPAQGATEVLHQYGTSAPLRMLARSPLPASPGNFPDAGVRPIAIIGEAFKSASEAPAARKIQPYVNTGGTRLNVEGLAAPSGGVGGAAGESQYVQTAGGQIAVYAKASGALLAEPANINALFQDAAPNAAMLACATHTPADASILYDQIANRWVLAFMAAANDGAPAYYQCIAVSASADAGGGYYRYALALTTQTGAAQYADDARIALWPDAYYLSFSLFDAFGDYAGARICGVDHHALAAGADALLRCHDLGSAASPVTPAGIEGYAAPDGNAAAVFFALDRTTSALLAWRFSWSSDVLSGPAYIPVNAFAPPRGPILQPQPGVPLETMADRIGPRAVYRNIEGRETVVVNHTIDIGQGQAAVRWYEIGNPLGTPYVIEHGTIGGGAESRFMAQAGVDKAGNIAIGYSTAAADTPPGFRYTGREMGDPLGLMQTEEIIVNGTGVQSGPASVARASGALTLDPIDGCTFWYTQRYIPVTGEATARTRIATFKFRSCR